MTFFSLAQRAARLIGASVLGAALLSACGGSTSQVDKFAPERVVAFGDELNYLTDDGHKYSINAVSSSDSSVIDCSSSPIWVQYVASTYYGKVFSQCQGTSTTPDITAYRMATEGATVDDLASQLSAYLAGSGLTDKDLATVVVGMHDVLNFYAMYDGTSSTLATLKVDARAKGALLATQVLRMTGTGARVLISTVPDLSLSPFALQEKADKGDDRPVAMLELVKAFNTGLRSGLVDLDGSQAGLLLADDLTRAMVRVPSSYGLSNVVDAACLSTATLPNCTTATLTTSATGSASAQLWADATHPGYTFHLYLGQQAVSRLNTLPF